MLLGNDIPASSWFATGGILLVALFLGLWQWFDQKSRVPDQFPEDREFFGRQDRRRYAGVALMALLALLLPLPTSDKIRLQHATLVILDLLIVCVLIVVLLVLAVVDGLATRRYARRHGRELAQEHAKLMLDVILRQLGGFGGVAGRFRSQEKTSGI